MATVILLRHGRTASNAGQALAGRQPVELDETGR
ncbi:MAG: histidine phosphatase family protein, partial [Micromonosporaceae bacterium]|nr:histidine phosphatase family protein [Micromonosporaceae bacterium]